MSNRHLSRTIVLQSLFEWDFEWDFVGLDNSKVEEILTYNTKEFSTGSCDFEFARKIIDNVIEKRDLIDDIIGKAAPQWPLEKISIIDRNVLRIGISELLFSDRNQVPPKVAINEAIELAKTFGGDNSGRFVSGVLGTIYKELGEPDKDQKTKNKNPIKDIPFEEMPIEKKCGAVVYSVHNDNVFIALVHDVFGHWTLSKGGLEKAEDERDCTVRKIKEEIGLDIELGEKLGENEYIAYDPEKGKTRRQVHYYFAKSEHKPLVLEEGGGLDQAKWFKLSEISELNLYNDILPIITKAIEILSKKKIKF